MVAKLIVVNGPPGIGKSTIAERYATTHFLTLWLDTDQIRGLIGGWEQARERAGRAARSLVVRMAHEHLSSGMDVIVSQLYGSFDDLQRLEDTARRTKAEFIEVVLIDNRSRAAQRFVERGGPKTKAFDEEDPTTGFLQLYDRLMAMAKERPQAAFVDSVPGQVDQTYQAFSNALRDSLADMRS